MRKSVLAMAAVAAMGAAGAANANFFTISSASVSGSNLNFTGGGSVNSGQSAADFRINTGDIADADAGDIDFTTGGVRTVNSISQTNADDIVTALGISGSGTVAYFGFDTGGGAPAFFGIAIIGNGSSMDTQMGNAHRASLGVYTNAGGSFSNSGLGDTYRNLDVVHDDGENYVYIFAGMSVGTEIGGGTISDSSFNVRYLSFDGSVWGVFASADGVSSSSLNYATYSIPVPAPMLLAGAGLIGAAALRRRMVKKA